MPRKTPINLSDSLPQVKPQGGQPKLAKEMRGKPLTHEYVASEIAKKGYVLRSQYKNSRTKLDIECDQGHRYSAKWNEFQQGRRCPECKCLSYEYVAAEIAKAGYVLRSQYRNARTHLDIECDRGHPYSVIWSSFQQGRRCPECAGNAPLTHEYVVSEIAKAGCFLRSEYKNSKTHLDIECDRGHPYSAKWSDFRRGSRCPHCAGVAPLTHEYVASEIAKAEYVLRSQYRNAHTHLDIECDQGHPYSAKWASFQQGSRCPECAGVAPLTHEYVASEFAKDRYTLESQYKNANTPLKVRCDKGHPYCPSWANFQQGSRCPECAVTGYKKHKPGRLYYIRFDFPNGLSLYKIGITNRTIGQRFANEPTPYAVLLDRLYKDGSIPPQREDRIKKRHAKDQYTGPNLLVSGITECFTRDILKLDTPACDAA
jgi:hypothetical protein